MSRDVCGICWALYNDEGLCECPQVQEKNVTKLKPVIKDHHKEQAAAILNEALKEEPDTVIVLCFWKDSSQFKIKVSTIPDRLTLIGALEEAKNKVITDGYVA